MFAATTALTATSTAATSTAATLSRVGSARQRGRKNNDGNPKFESQHDLSRSVRPFVVQIPPMVMIAAGLSRY